MQTQSCPAVETLHDFLLGRLSVEESGSLDQHLIQCDACTDRAGVIHATDDIVEAINAPKVCDSGFAGIDELVERGKQIFQDTRALASDETIETSTYDPADDSKSKPDPSSCSFLQPAKEMDEIGRFGDYRILSMLGSGGMGVVFLAEELSLRRQVALKVIRQGANQHTHERFLREARALAAVESDHIVTIHRVGDFNDVPFLEMPVLRGESLENCLRRQEQLSVLEVCRLGEQAALGLAAAHDRGLLHRDIKPGNIWLAAPDGRVKILDFGLVRHDDEPELTKLGTVVGTPQYMSPEQTQGDTIDHRSDLFSLGSVLYHAITGKTPFNGSSVVATLVEVASVEDLPQSAFVCTGVRFEGELDCDEEELAILNEWQPKNSLSYQQPGLDLWITGLPITGSCFAELGKIQQLASIRLDGCTNIDPGNLLHLQGKRLEGFFALGSNLGDELAAFAAKMSTLTHVDFGKELTGKGLRTLAGNSHLQNISFWGCDRLTPQDFEPLSGLSSLKVLQIGTSQTTPAFQEKLRGLAQVTTLSVRLDDHAPLQTLASFTDFQHIETLDLSYMSLGEFDMSPLSEIPTLSKLVLRNCGLSTDSIEKIRTLIPQCEILLE